MQPVRPTAHTRFQGWLVSIREKSRGRVERLPAAAAPLDLLRHMLPCRKSDPRADGLPECTGVVPERASRHATFRPFSFPCPCKLFERTLSKPALVSFLGFPWERVEPDAPRHGGGAWVQIPEEAILDTTARLVFSLRKQAALAPVDHPFDERLLLSGPQRASLRELLGVVRAIRLVYDEDLLAFPWSLLKDTYLREGVASVPEPRFTREEFLEILPRGGHVVVGFDTLLLRAAGSPSPETQSVSLFLRDAYERGCYLTCVSKYPFAAPSRKGRGLDQGIAFDGGAGGARMVRDEKGRLRVSRKRVDDEPSRLSFQGALDEGTFERLAEMVTESEAKWRELDV